MLTLLINIIFKPKLSIIVICLLYGKPELIDDLTAICYRESRCNAIKVHKIDEHLSDNGWYGQTKLGHLNKDCQPYKKGQWATRGAFGLSAASHWQYLPKCYQPEILDIPIVSADIAIRKYLKHCMKTTKGWCRINKKYKRNNK